MNIRFLNVLFSKSGSGSTNTRIAIPVTWCRQMGIKEDDRQVKVTFDGEKIIIEKEK